MKRKRISEALEHLDPAYIDEAAGFTAVRLYQKPLFRLVSVAACLIVCATAVLLSTVFDKQTPPVDTPPVTTTVTGNLTSADTTTTVVTTTATTTTTTATSITTEPSATVTTSTKKGIVVKGTKTTRTMTTTVTSAVTSAVTSTVTSTVENTTITSTTARKGDDLPIPPRGTTTDKDGGTTKSTSTRPTRPNGSFGETEFRPDVRLQLDKSVYTPDEAITVTIENTSEDTLYLYSLIFWATQTENGEWSNGWGATPLSFTTSVLEPGETCTATKRLSLSPDKTYALALCVGDTWIRSDTFRVMPSSTTTAAEAITTTTNAD
ncbi:MAG: hypothetical protein IJO59_07325 [Clostridia bacterium]|nr:hypothetical protein [Clostridia bacterium]